MEKVKKVHFIESTLLNPTNPVKINVIGAGGTGSHMVMELGKLNHMLLAFGHPGFEVTLWDDDIVTSANEGRQLFAKTEVGLSKAVSIINRLNRGKGFYWKAQNQKFVPGLLKRQKDLLKAEIYISCVDTVQARFEIAEILHTLQNERHFRYRPLYWMDCGNSRSSGQVLLSTIGTHKQPSSEKYATAGQLPFITEEYGELLRESEEKDDTPSCSLAEALQKQDLHINSSIAPLGCSILTNLFREGFIVNRGFFLNLKEFRCQPIPVS